RLEARQILRHELFPAISEYLFVNGDLPATIDEFSKNSGSAILFRDPCLAGPSVEKPSLEQSFVWIGKHEGKPLLPALPLCHTRNADPDGRKLLLMSDGSVHKLLDDELKKALDAGTKGEAAPFHSSQPQTLAEVGPLLVPLCGDGNSR
ncbi:MAG: hypothetical protein HUU29_12025, partial [Planctomycetaceae bacterium]|nr:hypothetical protein [Planctomycetaceae bacterium]